MNQKNTDDYRSAMQVFQELCVRHNVQPSEKLEELFWRGVLLGQNRANSRRMLHDKPIAKTQADPPRPKHLDLREPEMMSLSGSDAGGLGGSELGEAGSFRL